MKTLIRLMMISILMVVASPAHSEAIQIFNCQLEGDATNEDLMEMAKKWLDAAKTIKGGENLQVFIRHPVSAAVDHIDFKFVIATPDFAAWGAFTDAYESSTIADIDDEFEKIAICSESTLWEGGEIK